MGRTERFEQQEIDAAIEVEREGSHPIGYRAVKEVLEITPLAQQGYEGTING